MENLIDKISPYEALTILKQLAKADKIIEKKIIEIAEGIIRNVDVEEICEEVFFVLDGIDVHELWDRSGSTSYGYISPEEMAVEMIEEELDSFNQEVIRLCELNIKQETALQATSIRVFRPSR